MFGTEEVYTALNVSGVTDLLSAYSFSDGSKPSLHSNRKLPDDVLKTDKSILFYMSDPYNALLDVDQYTFTIACRAPSYTESREIASAVLDNINRVSYTNCYISCQLLPTIPPANEKDNFNTVVEAKVFKS